MARLLLRLLVGSAVLAAALATLAAPATAEPTAPPAPTVPTAPPMTGIDQGPPTTTPGPPGTGSTIDATPGEASPGFFDVGGRVRKAINDWFRDLVTSALDPVLDLLGRTVLATPPVDGTSRVRDLWLVMASIANGLFVLLVLAGGAIVMGHETVQTRYSAKEIAPRIVVGFVAANASLAVAGQAITAANALAAAVLGGGVDPAGATDGMKRLVMTPLNDGGIFLVLVGLVAAVLAVGLLVVYVIRVALLIVLVVAGPVCLACHALPQTEGLARLWWRGLIACLGVQVGQALVLITALRIFFAPDGRATLGLSSGGSLVDLLVVVCLLWTLLRIPAWASKAVFGGGHHSTTGRVARDVIVYRAIRAAKAAAL